MRIKVWSTLHEPRVVTAIIVGTYISMAAAGILLIHLAIIDTTDRLYDPLAFIAGLMLTVSGIIGAPASWTGRHWVERATALGIAAGGLCVMFMLSIAYWAHVSKDQPGVVSAFNLLWCVPSVALGLTRFERSRLAPYAEGKGPKLPEARKELAIQRMDSDWEAVMKRKED